MSDGIQAINKWEVSAPTWAELAPAFEETQEPEAIPVRDVDRMTRARCLDMARECVLTNRQEAYGPPEESFALIAKLWSAYLGQDVQPHDASAMMILFKVARFRGSPSHSDHMVDSAGYSAITAELAP